MPYKLYSYRLGKSVPLLTEKEFARLDDLLRRRIETIKQYRKAHGSSLEETLSLGIAIKSRDGEAAMDCYEEITGERLDRPEELFDVRLSRYGRPCPDCGRPFRSPEAKLCAECGFTLSEGEVAGPHPGATA